MSGEVPEDEWLVDSGASSDMTPKREYFTKYRSFSAPEKVALGDGRVVEAVGAGTTAAYLRNRTTTSANEEQLTPFERWYGHKPNISHLRVFGCAAYSHVPNKERGKLDKKAQRMCFIGYSKNPKGYRLINLNTNKVVTRRDVVFNETDFRLFKRMNNDGVSISPELLNESEDKTTEGEHQPEVAPRRSQ